MAISATFHPPPAALQALTVITVLFALLVADAEGRHHDCPPFSCGHLRDVSYPFHRRGDPPGCGVQSYELDCADAKATIRVGSATYDVVSINYTDSSFWVVENDLGTQSSCFLPRWDHHVQYGFGTYFFGRSNRRMELTPDEPVTWATFVNCPHPIENNGRYKPVTCRSTNSSFIYLMTGYFSYAENFEPSCGYLAMAPLNGQDTMVPENASYADVVKFMRKGFAIQFPDMYHAGYRECMSDRIRELFVEPRNSTGIKDGISDILTIDLWFWNCMFQHFISSNYATFMPGFIIALAMWVLKSILVVCRFMVAPLAVFIFLAHKYWKTRISIDAVEKFLRMQHMLGPTRYAYTDVTAITSHFREKLGQGGYGSVYKGVLLPGDVHVAVKMLVNSNCNGEEFISEVATIGRIHHVNVVRLVGFCSEEMRKALVYEYVLIL